MSRHSYHQPPENEWPTRVDLADDNPSAGPGYTPDERARVVYNLAAAQREARRNAYPVTRCDTWSCHTTVDLGDDPQALCDTCGLITCPAHDHICTGSAA